MSVKESVEMSVKESVEKRVKSKIEVPEGWGVKRLGDFTRIVMGQSPPSSTYNVQRGGMPFFQGNSDFGSKFPSVRLFTSKPTKKAYKNNILMSVRAPVGALNICNRECCIGRGLCSIDSIEGGNKFLFYLLKFKNNDLIKISTGSTFSGINKNALSNLKIVFPPFEEQQKIADILSKVDEQIDFTEKIIDKTEELKKGLMQKLLTKGIGHTKFKKTELGEIPEEWDIKRLDVITKIIVSNVDKKVNETEEPILLCNYKDVYDNDYICSKLNFMKGTANKTEINRFLLNKDDVIITKDSETKFDIAVPSVVIEDLNNVVCGYHLAILRPKSNLLDGLYLMNVLKTSPVNNHFVKFAQGLTRFGLTIDAINRAKMPLPPLNEQKQIASILSKVDEQIQDNKKELSHLQELKKGLMQDLLTGKVRVTT